MGKSRLGSTTAAVPSRKLQSAPAVAAAASHSSPNFRVSNGLKDFLWLLSDVENGRLLDLGSVSQATLNFFIERGFRVTTDDLVRSWNEFRVAEDERQRVEEQSDFYEQLSPGQIAERFLDHSLQYPEEGFNAVLLWDIFDHLGSELLPKIADRLYDIVKPGGAVLAIFHSKPEGLYRYRIVDNQTIETIPIGPVVAHDRPFQNREILNLFGRFRSAKTFVGRDQLREGLFVR
ncbi:MAG: class I SAM-dependent methyltransferase [Candidatus Acidiferrales bacterium]